MSLYQTLHRQGVAHLDVRPSNWLKAKDGKLTLIDFERARTRASFASSGKGAWADICKLELNIVLETLNAFSVNVDDYM